MKKTLGCFKDKEMSTSDPLCSSLTPPNPQNGTGNLQIEDSKIKYYKWYTVQSRLLYKQLCWKTKDAVSQRLSPLRPEEIKTVSTQATN